MMVGMFFSRASGLVFLTGLTLYVVQIASHCHEALTQTNNEVWVIQMTLTSVDAALITGWILIDCFIPIDTSCVCDAITSIADGITRNPLVQSARAFIAAKLTRPNGTTCLICATNEVAVLFEPCCHAALCAGCKPVGGACPVCRGAITRRRRVIYSGFT